MSNSFSKEEVVAFEETAKEFEDHLVLSQNVDVYNTNATQMERANDIIHRPMPYIAQSFDGSDQSGNFANLTQLSVPSQVNTWKSSPWTMTATERRDALQIQRFSKAAAHKLASDVNVALMNLAANQGTLTVKRTAAASGFDDVAKCDEIMNRVGVTYQDRKLALSSVDYNGMASNLAARENIGDKMASDAYRNASIGRVASFDTYKLDYANSLAEKTAATVTINGANQYHTPQATDSNNNNVDNRYQDIEVTVGSGTIAVGDAFTIADVYEVHHITKQSTGELKTFRVVAVPDGGTTGTITISPAIVSNGGSTDAEAMYQNVDSTPANGAALTFLNTVTKPVNPFWVKSCIELLPGKFEVDSDAFATMSYSTPQGVTMVMSRDANIDNLVTKYRMDIFFGTVMLQPQMAGIMLFSQT